MKNKTLTITLIVILSLLVILLTLFFINVLTNQSFRLFNFNISQKESTNLIFNKEYEEVFENIKIKSNYSNIELKSGIDEQIKVIIYGDEDNLQVNDSNQELDITSKGKTCVGFCFNQNISKIEIYLPSNYSGNIDIDSNYGDVKVATFNNMILNTSLDAGDINVNSLKSGKIKNKYGDITISSYSKDLDIEQNAGDVKVSEVDTIKVINNYGDIKIEKVNSYLNINEDCGDVIISSINLNESSSIHNSYGDIKIGSTNEIYINAKTSLGDVKINKNFPKSDITLNIDNSLGDIKVNN